MNKKEILGFNAKITPVKPLNKEMTLCKCYVLALGKNRNYSCITKEAVENALPTIYNIPVVGHMYVDKNGEYYMGGHDRVIVKDSDDRLVVESLCVPFGVVPQQDNIHFEEIIDSNGNKEIYQVADVILWTGRYPDLKKAVYDENIYFGQSMEINVESYSPLENDDHYTQINQFSYSALCLLGKSDDPEHHVEPCFPMSRVEPYNFSLNNEIFDEMMKEFKSELRDCFSAINIEKGGEDEVEAEVLNSVKSEVNANSCEEKDTELTEEVMDVKTEENLSDVTNATQENFSENDLADADNATDDCHGNVEQTDIVIDNQEDSEHMKNGSFSCIDKTMTTGEKLNAIDLAIRNVTNAELKAKGEDKTYLYRACGNCDETYAYIFEESVELESGIYSQRFCRIKYKLEDGVAELIGDFETVYPRYLTKEDIEKFDNLKAEYQVLKEFKEKRIEDDRIKEYDDVISEFSDLIDNEEFSLIRENKMSFETVEALREKCYAIRGKATVVNTTKKPEMKFAIDYNADAKPEVYGGFFSKYPPKSGKK